jgi:hypothetical protein
VTSEQAAPVTAMLLASDEATNMLRDLFVPNDSDQTIWLTWASDGKRRKMAANLHCSINFPQSSAMTVRRENVPICVRTDNALAATKSPRSSSWCPNRLDQRAIRQAVPLIRLG